MSITIYTGNDHRGKCAAFLDHLIANAKTSGHPVRIVVPQVAGAELPNTLLAQREEHLVTVTPINRWISLLWNREGEGKAIVSQEERRALLSRAATEYIEQAKTPDTLDYLNKRGVQNILEEFLIASGVRLVRSDYVSVEHALSSICADVLKLYDTLLNEFARIEPVDALEVLTQSSDTDDELVGLYGFSSFTAAQLAFIARRARVGHVAVSLDYRRDSLASRGSEALWRFLSAIDGAQSIEIDEPEQSNSGAELARALADEDHQTVRQLHDAQVFSLCDADGGYAQAAAVLAEVKQALTQYEPRDIAITTRAMSKDAAFWARTLEDWAIPASFDVRIPARSTLVWSTIAAILITDVRTYEIVVAGEAYLDQPRLTGASYLFTPANQLSIEGATALDRELRSRVTSFKERAQRTGASDAVGRAFIQALDISTVESWQLFFDNLLASFYERSGVSYFERACAAALHHHAALLMSEQLTAEEDLASEEQRNAIDAIKLFTSLLDDRLALTIRPDENAVLITDAQRLRGRERESIVFYGLEAHEFESHERDGSVQVLADKQLQTLIGEKRSNALKRRDEDVALFSAVLRAAQSHVSLVGCGHDEHGAEQSFAEPLRKLFDYCGEGASIHIATNDPLTEQLRWGFTPACSPEKLIQLDYSNSPERLDMRPMPPVLPVRGERSLERALFEKDDEDTIQRVFTPSEFETYLACPYSWFLNRALPAGGLDEDFSYMWDGVIVHAILKEFYQLLETKTGTCSLKGMEREKIDVLLGEAIEIVQGLREAHADAWTFTEERAFARNCRAARRRIFKDQTDLFDEKRNHTVKNLEMPFQVEFCGIFGGPDHYVHIPYKVKGRIDRVDLNGLGYCKVFDYKGSSNKYPAKKSLANLGLLQLGLYAMAYERETDSLVDGAGYLFYKGTRSCYMLEDPSQAMEALHKKSLPLDDERNQRSSQPFRDYALGTIQACALMVQDMNLGKIQHTATSVSGNQKLLTPQQKNCSYCPYLSCPVHTKVLDDSARKGA